MKDFLGTQLDVGDEVILTAPLYRHLVKAKVVAFTPKKVRVEYNNTWTYGSQGQLEQYLSEPNFLILNKKFNDE